MEQEVLEQVISKILLKITAYSIAAVNPRPFPIGVSNRHIHLSQRDLESLFGQGYTLQNMKELSQPGQYAAAETVILAGPKGSIEQVRVLGPVRNKTQIEILRGDAFKLGVSAPVRESGNLDGSGEITVIGPKGSIYIKEGLIIAKRHIHMHPSDALTYCVNDGQIVQVKVGGDRGAIFDNVVVRVSDKFSLDFHVDMDEANGAGIKHGDVSAHLLTTRFCLDGDINDAQNMQQKDNIIVDEPLKIITEATVRRAWERKAALKINKGVICTPLAMDTIKELGIKVI